MTLRPVALATLLTGALLAGCSARGGQPEPLPPAGAATQQHDARSPSTGHSGTPGEGASATTGPQGADTATGTGVNQTVTADSGAFRVRLPTGWLDVRSHVEQDVELAIRSTTAEADFYTNVVVARQAPIEDLDASLGRAAQDISGAEDAYEVLDPVRVAGQPAPGFTFSRTSGGVPVTQTQRWVQHDADLYIVTLSVARSRARQGTEVLLELLGSWEWRER